MRKIDNIDEIRRLELETLIDVDGFCRRNNIPYVLYFGTLIGAIRHKGFIPWDDDIDIAMFRSDYDRFLEIYRSERYRIASFANHKGYIYPFAKVYDSTTVLDERMKIRCDLGVGIDVFPIDGIEQNEKSLRSRVSKITFYKRIISGKLFWLNKVSLPKRLLIRTVSRFYSGKRVARKIEKLAKKVCIENSSRVGVIVFGNPRKNFMPKDYFSESIDVPFEGHMFRAPQRYHDVLSTLYGDYMMPPALNERDSSHHFDAYYK